jgi:hypothetical protein
MAKAIEAVKTLKSSREELSGVAIWKVEGQIN